MTGMTPGQLTEDVLAAYSSTPDPRLWELLAALTAHLHAFVLQTRLAPANGRRRSRSSPPPGTHATTEFILLSHIPGLSSLVDLVNTAPGATKATVLGPFYDPGALRRAPGKQIGRPEDGSLAPVGGRVTNTDGRGHTERLAVQRQRARRSNRHPGISS
jgi:hypothetical protein